MKTLKRLSKRAIEFCELCGYDVDKVKKNMKSKLEKTVETMQKPSNFR